MGLTVLPDNIFRELVLTLTVIVLIICIVMAGIFSILRFVFYPIFIKPLISYSLSYYRQWDTDRKMRLNNTK